jgi:hypothetical protein
MSCCHPHDPPITRTQEVILHLKCAVRHAWRALATLIRRS